MSKSLLGSVFLKSEPVQVFRDSAVAGLVAIFVVSDLCSMIYDQKTHRIMAEVLIGGAHGDPLLRYNY